MRTLAVSILVMNVTFMAAFATWVIYCTQVLGLTGRCGGRGLTCRHDR